MVRTFISYLQDDKIINNISLNNSKTNSIISSFQIRIGRNTKCTTIECNYIRPCKTYNVFVFYIHCNYALDGCIVVELEAYSSSLISLSPTQSFSLSLSLSLSLLSLVNQYIISLVICIHDFYNILSLFSFQKSQQVDFITVSRNAKQFLVYSYLYHQK